MKKILFIGKFNTVYQDIHDELMQCYSVQACVDNLDMVKGMLKIKMPDIVIVSLIAMGRDINKILREFKIKFPTIPVICIGTEAEQAHFSEFFEDSQFHALTRPISNAEILAEVLNVSNSVSGASGEDASAARPSNAPEQKRLVLLVDDNAIQLRSLYKILSDKYDVQMATSGMKALTMIGKKKPDIIFLDYEMPICDGRMTLQMIRELDEAKDIPVVFLTGMKDRAHIASVLELRPEGYLIKPASREKLVETIEKVLGRQAAF